MNFSSTGLPMETEDTSSMVKILSKSIPKLQFLRELTKNSIESKKKNSDKLIIKWNFDENYMKKSIYKLSITDTGCGLTQEDLLLYINKLSSSGKKLGINDNYGIGAKISGLAYSPFGIEYYSWVDGIGSYCKLKEFDGGNYGLEDLGRNTYTKQISIDEAPPEIIKTGHGTKVILLGSGEYDNTGIFEDKREISKYIARRFFRLPDDIEVNAIEGPYDSNIKNNSHIQLRKIITQKVALEENSSSFGVFNGDEFKVYWWILKENVSDKNDSAQQLNRLSGHFGLLYKDELYEIFEKGASINKMQDFGIKIGGKKIVLYLELLSEKAHPNPERTTILIDGEKLDFERYGLEFSNKMPRDIRNYIEEKAKKLAYDNTDWQKNIDNLLKDLGMGKLKKDSKGNLLAVFDENNIEKTDINNKSKNKNSKDKLGYENKLGLPSKYKSIKIPDAYFCSSFPDKYTMIPVTDYSELTDKSPSDYDKAAKYVRGTNALYVNLDFRALEKIMDFVISKIDEKDETLLNLYKHKIIHVYSYNLIEAIVSVLVLAKSGKWEPEKSNHALSSEALTAVSMIRSNVIQNSLEEIKNIKKN